MVTAMLKRKKTIYAFFFCALFVCYSFKFWACPIIYSDQNKDKICNSHALTKSTFKPLNLYQVRQGCEKDIWTESKPGTRLHHYFKSKSSQLSFQFKGEKKILTEKFNHLEGYIQQDNKNNRTTSTNTSFKFLSSPDALFNYKNLTLYSNNLFLSDFQMDPETELFTYNPQSSTYSGYASGAKINFLDGSPKIVTEKIKITFENIEKFKKN